MENKEMSNMIAIKIIIILLFIFCNNIFAYRSLDCSPPSKKERSKLDDFYRNLYKYEREGILASCDDTLTLSSKEREVHPSGCFTFLDGLTTHCPSSDNEKLVRKCERTSIHTNYYEGMKQIEKEITCKDFHEKIVTLYDKKDSVLFFKHYKWEGEMLIQTIDDDIVRNIIPGKTSCDFTIIEPSGDSISFHLHPKQNPSGRIKNRNQFANYMNGHPLIQKFKVKAGKHDAIIYHWQLYCKDYYETEELIRGTHHLDMENEQEIAMKDGYASPYKHYAIISICIIAASIVALRKKWRTKK
jgi:hypothetical protein